MGFRVIHSDEIRLDPSTMGALAHNGWLVVHPAAYWQQFNPLEISAFCVRHGIYCVPTQELVDWLQQEIAGQSAIEIGAGNGVLAEALNVQATDNKMQLWPEIAAHYAQIKQTPVRYGPNVLTLAADEAVQTLKPEVVIAAWVTHLYDSKEHWRGGNAFGVAEEAILPHARYVFIGNQSVHGNKRILGIPHKKHAFPWLISRAFKPEDNFIAVWEKQPL